MGGFVDAEGHPIVTKAQLASPLASVVKEIQAIEEAGIDDRSKGDMFSKVIALCQGLWFIAQCLARKGQHLPITALEVATLAFAVVNALTWLLWLKKPLDVCYPIRLPLHTAPIGWHNRGPPYPAALSWFEHFGGVFTNLYHTDEYDPLDNTSVPTFWCARFTDYSALQYSSILSWSLADSSQLICGVLFGAIHCSAWSAAFPSPAEMWLWRSSALLITVLPYTFVFGIILQRVLSLNQIRRGIIAVITVYSAARVILLIVPLTALRALPIAAFSDVEWSIYIPHL
ncbi:hypothetical protein MIND_00797700 [Mycena indigotica]|uniref:Uncharacterized protein n=1 Tax=Mycena indigotica TaxID=2126181 RepID=A0A8H6SP14_9AGAR|nr:uncharacterized protein MIND_00797700 [Mycena indigotica]KAF7302302.1 hypothetical protein MIND_00797700 [Mycena indigotica]